MDKFCDTDAVFIFKSFNWFWEEIQVVCLWGNVYLFCIVAFCCVSITLKYFISVYAIFKYLAFQIYGHYWANINILYYCELLSLQFPYSFSPFSASIENDVTLFHYAKSLN
jgi:hypothetical protein